MPPLFHKNAILTGYVDHYCLVCEAHLKGEEDIAGHIAKPIHRKNLDAAGYVEKFADDFVRKVKKGYYCEYCNILLSTAAKVNLHVAESKHNTNKGSCLLTRSGNSVLAFRDVLIGEKAWNGLIEETCAACNTEFDDEPIHKTEPNHILSLVQTQVGFGAGKAVYRKIDDGSFQCLTCNKVLAIGDLDIHFELTEHKEAIQIVEIPKTETKTVPDKKVPETDTKMVPDKKVPKSDTVVPDKKVSKSNTKTIPVKEVPKDDKKTVPDKKTKIEVTYGENQITLKKVPVTTDTNKTVETKPKLEEKAVKKQEVKTEPKKTDEKPFELKFHFGEVPKKKEAGTKTEVKNEGNDVKKTEAKKEEPRPPIKLKPATTDIDEEICKVLNAKDYIAQDEHGKRWCLMCDWTMEPSAIENHIRGRHHLTMIKMHKKRIAEKMEDMDEEEKTRTEPEKAKKVEVEETVADVESQAKILDNVNRFQSNEIHINFESRTAMCKKCVKYIDFSYDFIDNHIEEHKKENKANKEAAKKEAASEQAKNEKATPKPNKINEKTNAAPKPTEMEAKKPTATKNTEKETKKAAAGSKNAENETKKAATNSKTNENDPKKANTVKTDTSSRSSSVASKDDPVEAEHYAKTNNLIHSRGGPTVYCKICDSRTAFTLRNMREHVTGVSHKKKALTIQKTAKLTTKIPTKEFIKNLTAVENSLVKDLIINEKLCVNLGSFMMMARHHGGLKCYACDVDMNLEEVDIHYSLPPHEKAMSDCLVITSLDTEFIRELHAGLLHCGYCNVTVDTKELNAHFTTCCHRESKAFSRWRLHQYMHEIAQKQRRDMDVLEILRVIGKPQD